MLIVLYKVWETHIKTDFSHNHMRNPTKIGYISFIDYYKYTNNKHSCVTYVKIIIIHKGVSFILTVVIYYLKLNDIYHFSVSQCNLNT